MHYRSLGSSNLKVSTLCLGTMMFGDQTGAAEAANIVADARANGVNDIDTADVYSKGASETMVGDLPKGQRHDWVLANPSISSVIAGPRTLTQWQDYPPALDYTVTSDDEVLVDGWVRPGHSSTPGYTDPAYPLNGRVLRR